MPLVHSLMQSSVDYLKSKLLESVDEQNNVINMAGALDVISKLEEISLNKDILETTRLGAVVNNVRKQNQQTFPDLSKRCKNLIRDWQRLLSVGPAQSSPSIPPLGLGRLTPLTPANAVAVRAGISPRGLTPKSNASPVVRISNENFPAAIPLHHLHNVHSAPQLHDGLHHLVANSYAPVAAVSISDAQVEQAVTAPSGGGIKLKIKIGGKLATSTVVTSFDSDVPCDQTDSSASLIKRTTSSSALHDGNADAEQQMSKVQKLFNDARVEEPRVNGTPFTSTTVAMAAAIAAVRQTSTSPGTTAINSNDVLSNRTLSSTESRSLESSFVSNSVIAPQPTTIQKPKLKTTAELLAELTGDSLSSTAVAPQQTTAVAAVDDIVSIIDDSKDIEVNEDSDDADSSASNHDEQSSVLDDSTANLWVIKSAPAEDELNSNVRHKRARFYIGEEEEENSCKKFKDVANDDVENDPDWSLTAELHHEERRSTKQNRRKLKLNSGVSHPSSSPSIVADDNVQTDNFLPEISEIVGSRLVSANAAKKDGDLDANVDEDKALDRAKSRHYRKDWYAILSPVDWAQLDQLQSKKAVNTEFCDGAAVVNGDVNVLLENDTDGQIDDDRTSLPPQLSPRFVVDSELNGITGCLNAEDGKFYSWRDIYYQSQQPTMPYCDIGIPDFVEYNFVNQEPFLSPENYIYTPKQQSNPTDFN